MAKPRILSRSVKVDITISEKTDETSYGSTKAVSSHTIEVALPARSVDIASSVKDALDLMRGTVDRFHGELPDVDAEAVITSEASV